MLTFVEAPLFSRKVIELWPDVDYTAFQQFLSDNPEAGDVIPGSGGLRKIRGAAKGKGKRGGARIIYLLLVNPGMIYFVYIYTKSEMADLSPDQKKRFRAAVEDIKSQFMP